MDNQKRKIYSHKMMKILVLCFLMTVRSFSADLKTENEWSDLIAEKLKGDREFAVKSGRVDILTDEHAIEVEWASKWKQSIGQSLWYSFQTNRKAKVILLLKKESDENYARMLRSVILHNELKIEVETYRAY